MVGPFFQPEFFQSEFFQLEAGDGQDPLLVDLSPLLYFSDLPSVDLPALVVVDD
jgi:hypothetical protein